MSMNNSNNLSKKNITYLIIAVFSIGTIVGIDQITNATALKNATALNADNLNNVFNCITQKVNKSAKFTLADAFVCYDNILKGSLKYANQPFQNPDLSHLNNSKPFSTDTTTTKDSGTKSNSKTPHNTPVNLHVVKALKDDKVTSSKASKQPHGIDVFLKLSEISHGDSGTKSAAWKSHHGDSGTKSGTKTTKLNGNHVTQDVSNPHHGDKNVIMTSNVDVKSKIKSLSPTKPSLNSFDPILPVSNSQTPSKHTISSSFNSTQGFKSFSLPFTALAPK